MVAGGGAKPKGFIDKFEKIARNLKLPFTIKDIRLAKDPHNSVVSGCLAFALASLKKMQSGKN